MARIRNLCIFGLLLVSGASPLFAQDVFIQNEPQIILPIGLRSWDGTPEELRRINRVSVPSSYRERCEREGLPYSTIHPSISKIGCHHDLLNWHFNFGTARSAKRALDYIGERLAREYDLSPKDAVRYTELVPQGLSEAETYLAEAGLTYEEFLEENRVIEERRYPALAELRDLKEKLIKSSHVAALYIRAADWYRSAPLLSEATRWHRYLPHEGLLADKEYQSDQERLLRRVAQYRQDEFMELSLAVARAATESTEESILAANEASARAYKLAFEDPDFRYNKGPKVEPYRYLRFRLGLLADVVGLDITRHEGVHLGDYEFRHIEKLLRPDDRSVDQIHHLALPVRRKFIEAIIAQGEYALEVQPDCSDDNYNHKEALNMLFNSGRIVSPAHRPAPYRRIAKLYVGVYSMLKVCKGDEGDPRLGRETHYQAQARFYRQFLDNYEEIALGR